MRPALALAVLATTALAPPAHAATFAAPPPPQTLPSSGPVLDQPAVAISAAGDAVAVWGDDSGDDIDAAYRPAGGVWTDLPNVVDGQTTGLLQLEMDAAGNATVMWRDTATNHVQVAYRPAGTGPFEAPVNVSNASVKDPALAVAADGRAVVGWITTATGNIQATRRFPGDASFFDGADVGSAPDVLNVTATNANRNSTVAGITSTGRTILVWQKPTDKDIESSFLEPNGFTFSDVSDVRNMGDGEGAAIAFPQIATDAQGGATVNFEEFPTADDVILRSARLTGQTGWTAPQTLSQVHAGPGSFPHALAVTPDGTRYAAWSKNGDADYAVAPPGEAWTTAPGLPLDSIGSTATLATGPDGLALAAYSTNGFPGEIRARQIAADATVGPVLPFTAPPDDPEEEPRAAVDGDGDVVVVWRDVTGPVDHIRAVVGDAAPSTLSLTAPGTLLPGETGTFEATASPDFAGVAPTATIDFGDGTSASGPSATHAYAAPGTYTVTATASDSFGQPSATQTATVEVPAPPIACCAPPPNRVRTAQPDANITSPGRRVRRKRFRTIRGTASDQIGLARVEIALIRLRGKAKFVATTAAKKRCLSLRPTGRVRRQKGRCVAKTFLAATGTTNWSFRLRRRVPRGRYVLVARAVGSDGAVESGFSRADRNLKRFRVVR